jgi:hypothetical protein
LIEQLLFPLPRFLPRQFPLSLGRFLFRPDPPHRRRISERQADPRRQQRHVVGFVAGLFGLAAAA